MSDFNDDSGVSMGSSGVIEIDADVTQSLNQFIFTAERLLGHNAAHSRAIYDTALEAAHNSVLNKLSGSQAAAAIIEAVWTQALTSYGWIAPNRLFNFADSIDEVKIGCVRAMRTNVFMKERAKTHPGEKIGIELSSKTGFERHQDGTIILQLPPVCWFAEVDAILQHVETEGKWLIDVAISYLGLRHKSWSHSFPKTGDQERHPIKQTQIMNEGAKIQGPNLLAGGGSSPPWYDIDVDVVATSENAKFIADAEVIFSPPRKSLAERVSQGLGWLSRGRQTDDRAERLLYFFTAIEALLSSDDKSAPVTQTIARHAAVILSNDNQQRREISNKIKKLYAFRSSLVHAGNRSVSSYAANEAQDIAEDLYFLIFEHVDLKSSHESFNKSLADASYGTPWL